MNDLGDNQDGQTPLTPDELDQLIPGHITTRGELNELEGENIKNAMAWLSRRGRGDPLSIEFMRKLHQRMYGDVWKWAGQYSQQYDRFLGVDANQIEAELRMLLDDANAWIELGSYSDPNELLATFHHRLTKIHPFPNGNGRWSRLMTDQVANKLEYDEIRWGGGSYHTELERVGTETRDQYIAALRAADGHDIRPLTDLIRAWSDEAEE